MNSVAVKGYHWAGPDPLRLPPGRAAVVAGDGASELHCGAVKRVRLGRGNQAVQLPNPFQRLLVTSPNLDAFHTVGARPGFLKPCVFDDQALELRLPSQ